MEKKYLFGFHSANSLRKNLDRKIKRIKLPEGSSIKVEEWQCHNLRVSKCTKLYREGMKLADIMKVSGHRSVASLMRYIKVDEDEIIKG